MKGVIYRDLGLKKILKQAQEAGDYRLKVGVVGAQAQIPTHDGRLTMGELGALMELGSAGKFPARPFIAEGLNERKAEIGMLSKVVAQGIVLRQTPAIEGLAWLGERLAKMVQEKVESNMAPESAMTTVMKKDGFDHTLIDTGGLHDAIGYKVVRKIEGDFASAEASVEGVLGDSTLANLGEFEGG